MKHNTLTKTLTATVLSSVFFLHACSSDSNNSSTYSDDAQDDSNAAVSDFRIGDEGSTDIGTVLVGTNGMTLYTFENDRNDTDGDGAGDSDCNDGCASAWPPAVALSSDVASGNYSIITRDDGETLQWAFKGLPLYFFGGDLNAGDFSGDGIGGTWFVARPNPFSSVANDLGDILTATAPILDVDSSGGVAETRSDKSGFALYVFDNDANDTGGDGAGDSDCNDGCALAWPPLFAEAGATENGYYTLIDRDDGTKQWAFKGEPLYFFAGDGSAGDTNGDQPGGTWHVARLAPVQRIDDETEGDIFAARGEIADVNDSGSKLSSTTDKTGFALYKFDNDASDSDGDGASDSDCNGTCASVWPPLYAEENDKASGDFTIITRDDGTLQWAYEGAPLYFYAFDNNAGDTDGTAIPGWNLVTL